VQRLRNKELEQEVAEKKQIWRLKKKSDEHDRSADACMAFFLPSKFIAPEDQDVQKEMYSDFDESEYQDLMAQLVLIQRAIFDIPAKHQHLMPLYERYVNGKPQTNIFVDGGADINIMPYTTFRKLGITNEELLKTDMVLRDFAGNPSDTRGAVHAELMIGSKTLITTFFVIDGKGAYSLLLGRDWIHANCWIPSTMHQVLIQWIGDDVEVVHADDSVIVESMEPAYWECDGIDCFFGRVWGEGPMNVFNRDQQPIQAVGSQSNF
jgi:hypothetical protein